MCLKDSIPQTEGLSTRLPGCGFRDAAWDQPADSGQPVSISQPERVWHSPRGDSRRDDQDDQQPGLVQRLGYVGEQVDEAPGKKREVSPGDRTEPGVGQAPLTALPALEDAPALGHRLGVHTLPVAPLLCAPGPPMRSECTRSARPDWVAARSPGSVHPRPSTGGQTGSLQKHRLVQGPECGEQGPLPLRHPPRAEGPWRRLLARLSRSPGGGGVPFPLHLTVCLPPALEDRSLWGLCFHVGRGRLQLYNRRGTPGLAKVAGLIPVRAHKGSN